MKFTGFCFLDEYTQQQHVTGVGLKPPECCQPGQSVWSFAPALIGPMLADGGGIGPRISRGACKLVPTPD